MSLSFELSHEFEHNTQTQNSLKMSHNFKIKTQNSKLKNSLSFELGHEFEHNTQTQNSPKMSYSTQNSVFSIEIKLMTQLKTQTEFFLSSHLWNKMVRKLLLNYAETNGD